MMPVRVLLVEDSPIQARLIGVMLSDSKAGKFDIVHVNRLALALERLAAKDMQVVLLDLVLPDSHGLDTFRKVRAEAKVPIIVMSSLDDEALAVQALEEGAQDYLVKAKVDTHVLARALHYAVERHRLQEELRAAAITDELTGLYNRKGFFTLARQQLMVAHRRQSGCLLLSADLDGLKRINDTFGYQEGDQALIEIAYILRGTFRQSDVVARIGGDEFVVLAIDAQKAQTETLTARLQENLDRWNREPNRGYRLSLSSAVVEYDPTSPCSLEELLNRGDRLIYQRKQGTPAGDQGIEQQTDQAV